MAHSDDWSYFERLAASGGWQKGRSESLSGSGSSLQATAALRRRLVYILDRLGVRSLVDAPCGDMNWMRQLEYQFEKYIGIDVAPTLISKLKSQQFPAQYHFQVGNIATDILPAADAVFCRDCLVHMSFQAIQNIPNLWKAAGFRFMFVTTFVDRTFNVDCPTGSWRPLNMQIAPLNWPEPVVIIPEDCQDEGYADKAIGVWRL